MFGAKTAGIPTVEENEPLPPAGVVLNTETVKPQVKVDVFSLTKTVSLVLTVLLLVVLIVDSFLVYRRKTVRLSGHNFAHLIFLLALLVALNLIGRGIVL